MPDRYEALRLLVEGALASSPTLRGMQVGPTTIAALLGERDRYRVALEEIAALAEVAYHGQECVCGHKPMFCHRVNADRWCGGTTSPAIWRARAALESREEGS